MVPAGNHATKTIHINTCSNTTSWNIMNIQVLKIHKRGSKVYGKNDVMNIFGKFIRNNPWWNPILVGIYLFKVNNRNTRTRYEICSKLTIKTPGWRPTSKAKFTNFYASKIWFWQETQNFLLFKPWKQLKIYSW